MEKHIWTSEKATEYFEKVLIGLKEKSEKELFESLGENITLDPFGTCHNLDLDGNRGKFFGFFERSRSLACIETDFEANKLIEMLDEDRQPNGLVLEAVSYYLIGVYVE